jgi:hypothetical protein
MGDIGTGGELHFMSFCTDGGVTANKSQTDRHGWDVLIELEQDTGYFSQSTLHEPIITGTVQVKSTRSKKLTVDVTLSNLRKMATSPLPAFYVLVDYSSGPLPHRAFIRHVDEMLIGQILERVNTHIVEGNGNVLHRKKLRIDFGLGLEISLVEPASFKSALVKFVGRSPSRYTERKLRFLQTVGYDSHSQTMTFELTGLDNLVALADATMGMGGIVELAKLNFHPKRFGLADPLHLHKGLTGTLEVHPSGPAAEGSVTFRDGSSGVRAEMPASLYVSAMHNSLPPHLRRIRVDGGNFELLMSEDGSNSNFKVTIDDDTPVELEQLCALFQIICMLHDPKAVSVELKFNGKLAVMPLTAVTSLRDYSGPLRLAETLLELKALFRDRGSLCVSPTDLVTHLQAIGGTASFLRGDTNATVTLTLTGVFEPFEAVCLVPLSLVIGGKAYVAVVAVTGAMTPTRKGKFALRSKMVESLYKTVIREDDLDEERILAEIEPVLDRYTNNLPVLNLVPAMLRFGS